ncbi:alanine racemase [Nocardioides zhouii]|uniref:YhfX family PLP-dependent enzyme n=1 Tax=Nocardioides zhouii TaxID=1168729 RepID=A0A4Q2SNY9_9ACTN|nr:alanine racemase [Nocardioides zhouii]RYC05920.1 YhfX family PLP-dependent enzyme [Nocardioides zhouii]
MFIDVTRRRNPRLIDVAVELHQSGRLPSNCYVIDLDTVSHNAGVVAAAAASHGLTAYQMTKQFGRNAVVARAVAVAGIERVVAVDFEEARLLRAEGLRMGNVGHLVQVPQHEIARAVDMESDFITVFGFDQAERISRAMAGRERHQDVLLRVVGPGDTFYPAQRGGVPLDECVGVARQIDALPGVRLRGVTSFPVVLWDEALGAFGATNNLSTLRSASEAINDAGVDAPARNTPSACCSATFGLKAGAGSTHVEPGSCLTGQTPLHAVSDEPELPAMVYVSEISHTTTDAAYSVAGGLYPRSRARTALVYDAAGAEPRVVRVELDPAEAIDYYGTLRLDDPRSLRIGSTVVYAFRAQAFVSKCFVAVVSGVGAEPTVEGIFTSTGFRLGEDLLPIGGQHGRTAQ